jgi:hypothetical protein
MMNSNRSESWLAVKPGTEDAVGLSKFFFDKYSTFYNFYDGAYTIRNGQAGRNTFLPGYECVTTGSQDMPPSWTNNTDPNVACPGVFIGDYFGLAISNANMYALSVSTHYPSSVNADGGGRVYYQQQVLATIPRSGFGTGY